MKINKSVWTKYSIDKIVQHFKFILNISNSYMFLCCITNKGSVFWSNSWFELSSRLWPGRQPITIKDVGMALCVTMFSAVGFIQAFFFAENKWRTLEISARQRGAAMSGDKSRWICHYEWPLSYCTALLHIMMI